MPTASELFVEAEDWRLKSEGLAFVSGNDITYPDCAVAYFSVSETLREQAFQKAMLDAVNVLKVIANGLGS